MAPIWASALTPTQRAGWATYAANVTWLNRLGDTVHLSGQMEFCRSNWPRLQANLALVLDAPTVFDRASVGTPPTLTLSPASNVGTLTMDVTAPWIDYSTETALLLFVGIPRSGGITFQKKRTRRSAVVRASVMPLPEFTFGLPFTVPDYLQSWPAWVVATMADGRLTTPVPLATVYTGPPPPTLWEDAFSYADGTLTGDGDWIATPGEPIALIVDTSTATATVATDAFNDATNAVIDRIANIPLTLEFTFQFTTVSDTGGGSILVVMGGLAGPSTLLIQLGKLTGDSAAGQLSLIEATTPTDDEIASNVPCAWDVPHTLRAAYDGTLLTVSLDSVIILTATGPLSFTAPTVSVGIDRSVTTDGIALHHISLFIPL